MTSFKKTSLRAAIAALALCSCTAIASARGITRVPIHFPGISIAAAVVVPPGYTTYYISGAGGGIANPKAPKGSVARLGDTETQTASALKRLKAELAKLGLSFGDVVAAHVYLVGVPSMGGKMDFKGMNKAWSKEFGTKAQPNKPARAAVQVAGLAMPGGLVEIELIAAKKAK